MLYESTNDFKNIFSDEKQLQHFHLSSDSIHQWHRERHFNTAQVRTKITFWLLAKMPINVSRNRFFMQIVLTKT